MENALSAFPFPTNLGDFPEVRTAVYSLAGVGGSMRGGPSSRGWAVTIWMVGCLGGVAFIPSSQRPCAGWCLMLMGQGQRGLLIREEPWTLGNPSPEASVALLD